MRFRVLRYRAFGLDGLKVRRSQGEILQFQKSVVLAVAKHWNSVAQSQDFRIFESKSNILFSQAWSTCNIAVREKGLVENRNIPLAQIRDIPRNHPWLRDSL